jgi:cysteine desulfurase
VFEGLGGETVLLELESRGILSSSGSACAAGRTEPSHVLLAMGLGADAGSAVRFTWGATTTGDELLAVARTVGDATAALRTLAL